ncbi:MAG TPA: hypothetical protein PLD25_12210 [Chloroflexota bacterium]|nr:hypothetical protein [Chloroflexota bacterium]HUM71068.1 hypothetical protein [Chloroflexota bacterium]
MTSPGNSFKQSSTPPLSSITTGFEPSAEQLARATALRRFNRLYIYLPVGLVTAVVLLITLYLLIIAIFQPSPELYLFLSGLADFVLILMLLPVVLIFGLVMTAVIGGYVYYNYFMDEADRPIPPAPPYGRVRTLLWRADSFLLLIILPKLRHISQRISQPIIRFNGWFAYIQSWLDSLRRLVVRD